MSDKCVKCGVSADKRPLYSDGFAGHLPGMYCWVCYHREAINRQVQCFNKGIVGDNSGYIKRGELWETIADALEETIDNMDMGVAIGTPIAGSYTALAIVRNGQLYIRVADMSELIDYSPDHQRASLENLFDGLDLRVVTFQAQD